MRTGEELQSHPPLVFFSTLPHLFLSPALLFYSFPLSPPSPVVLPLPCCQSSPPPPRPAQVGWTCAGRNRSTGHQPEGLSHPRGPAEGRPFSLEGRKGPPLEERRGEEKWLLQPGAGPASFPANQRSRQRRASWLLGCATNPVSARPSSCTMALTKSTGRIVLLSPGSWQLKTLWVQPSSLESSTMLLCDLNIFNFICIARKS